jgi:hypothetical protein
MTKTSHKQGKVGEERGRDSRQESDHYDRMTLITFETSFEVNKMGCTLLSAFQAKKYCTARISGITRTSHQSEKKK